MLNCSSRSEQVNIRPPGLSWGQVEEEALPELVRLSSRAVSPLWLSFSLLFLSSYLFLLRGSSVALFAASHSCPACLSATINAAKNFYSRHYCTNPSIISHPGYAGSWRTARAQLADFFVVPLLEGVCVHASALTQPHEDPCHCEHRVDEPPYH